MTREIKFRGKRLDNGEWLEGDLCTRLTPKGSMTTCPVIQTTCWTIGTWFVHPDTVGRFTSLKDRNGKEIYEGDIIRREGLPEIVAEVVYENGEFICVGHYRVNGGLGWMLKRGLQLEVIGNIHDNKELLWNRLSNTSSMKYRYCKEWTFDLGYIWIASEGRHQE